MNHLPAVQTTAIQPALPVILVQLIPGALILVDVHSRQTFKMPTTLRVGSAQDLMKSCPFSHARVVIDDEAVAGDIFQAALKACPFVDSARAALYLVQPQAHFVNDIAKCELEMLSHMVLRSGYPIVDIQFFLNDAIGDDDWQYFTHLPHNYTATESATRKGGLLSWLHKNL